MAERFASHHANRSEATGKGRCLMRPDRLAGDDPTVPYGRQERGEQTPG